MTNGPDGPQGLARDWITIWQSELSAAATDRDRAASWARAVGVWADCARAAAALLPQGARHDGTSGGAAPQPSAGSAPAAAAPDARDAAIERLAARVAELERRLVGTDTVRDG